MGSLFPSLSPLQKLLAEGSEHFCLVSTGAVTYQFPLAQKVEGKGKRKRQQMLFCISVHLYEQNILKSVLWYTCYLLIRSPKASLSYFHTTGYNKRRMASRSILLLYSTLVRLCLESIT